mgnify:CR=1 FL=1
MKLGPGQVEALLAGHALEVLQWPDAEQAPDARPDFPDPQQCGDRVVADLMLGGIHIEGEIWLGDDRAPGGDSC